MICYVVSSNLPKQVEFGRSLVSKVKSLLDVDAKLVTSPKDIERVDCCIVLVASGGTERLILEIVKRCKPVLIWAIPYNNSLPSALEVCSLRKDVKLIYSDLDEGAVRAVKDFFKLCEVVKKDRRFGLIGGISDWILTSDESFIERFGRIVRISMDELMAEIDVDYDSTRFLKALKVYKALKKIMKRYDLSALTVKCFDLLKIDTTACLALSLLNDEGIIAGCEGDLDSLLTMTVIKELTGQPCWMANLNRFDLKSNTVTFSHCTVPLSMVRRFDFKTHMESGKGVAIEGVLRNEVVTVARFSRGKMLLTTGRIIRSGMGDDNLCRTQVEVRLDCKVEDFLNNVLGNHHVIVYGDHRSILIDFCEFTDVEPIVL